jgi:hypothetical protein
VFSRTSIVDNHHFNNILNHDIHPFIIITYRTREPERTMTMKRILVWNEKKKKKFSNTFFYKRQLLKTLNRHDSINREQILPWRDRVVSIVSVKTKKTQNSILIVFVFSFVCFVSVTISFLCLKDTTPYSYPFNHIYCSSFERWDLPPNWLPRHRTFSIRWKSARSI